jgi:hypothetical protein
VPRLHTKHGQIAELNWKALFFTTLLLLLLLILTSFSSTLKTIGFHHHEYDFTEWQRLRASSMLMCKRKISLIICTRLIEPMPYNSSVDPPKVIHYCLRKSVIHRYFRWRSVTAFKTSVPSTTFVKVHNHLFPLS